MGFLSKIKEAILGESVEHNNLNEDMDLNEDVEALDEEFDALDEALEAPHDSKQGIENSIKHNLNTGNVKVFSFSDFDEDAKEKDVNDDKDKNK